MNGREKAMSERKNPKKAVQRCMKSNNTGKVLERLRRGRIIKDEPNYCVTVFSARFHTEREWIYRPMHSVLKDLLCAILYPERPCVVLCNKPITWKLCNHRSLLLLFIRFIGREGKCSNVHCCCVCLPKCKKNLQLVNSTTKDAKFSSLKLRVAVVSEIYGLKFIYNFS